LALTLLISSAAGIGWSWWRHHQMQLPAGIAYGNGRLEADAIDIDTKSPAASRSSSPAKATS
jgi:HlyD family secretion protein